MAKRKNQGAIHLTEKSAPIASATGYADVTTEQVRLRAYELFELRVRRGSSGGPLDDWLQAERELRFPAEEALAEPPRKAVARDQRGASRST